MLEKRPKEMTRNRSTKPNRLNFYMTTSVEGNRMIEIGEMARELSVTVPTIRDAIRRLGLTFHDGKFLAEDTIEIEKEVRSMSPPIFVNGRSTKGATFIAIFEAAKQFGVDGSAIQAAIDRLDLPAVGTSFFAEDIIAIRDELRRPNRTD